MVKMQLNINSPVYYTNIFGVEDEIYWFNRELAQIVKDKQYSLLIDTIGIVPIIVPKDILEKGTYKENRECKLKYRFAYISKYISYEQYVNADIDTKKKLIVKNLLDSINAIKIKCKFDYTTFKKDVLEYLDFSEDEINNL